MSQHKLSWNAHSGFNATIVCVPLRYVMHQCGNTGGISVIITVAQVTDAIVLWGSQHWNCSISLETTHLHLTDRGAPFSEEVSSGTFRNNECGIILSHFIIFIHILDGGLCENRRIYFVQLNNFIINRLINNMIICITLNELPIHKLSTYPNSNISKGVMVWA